MNDLLTRLAHVNQPTIVLTSKTPAESDFPPKLLGSSSLGSLVLRLQSKRPVAEQKLELVR